MISCGGGLGNAEELDLTIGMRLFNDLSSMVAQGPTFYFSTNKELPRESSCLTSDVLVPVFNFFRMSDLLMTLILGRFLCFFFLCGMFFI